VAGLNGVDIILSCTGSAQDFALSAPNLHLLAEATQLFWEMYKVKLKLAKLGLESGIFNSKIF